MSTRLRAQSRLHCRSTDRRLIRGKVTTGRSLRPPVRRVLKVEQAQNHSCRWDRLQEHELPALATAVQLGRAYLLLLSEAMPHPTSSHLAPLIPQRQSIEETLIVICVASVTYCLTALWNSPATVTIPSIPTVSVQASLK
jgi:hypothetical protein